MAGKSPLDDPGTAQFAWARFRKVMKIVGIVTIAVVALVLWLLHDPQSEASIHYYIAIALGVAGVMMLAGALMGLVFMSAGSGHDHSIDD